MTTVLVGNFLGFIGSEKGLEKFVPDDFRHFVVSHLSVLMYNMWMESELL